MNKIVDAASAVSPIADGSTVGCVGVIGWVTPDVLLKALGDRFRKTARPSNLTFYFPVGTGDAQGIKGMDHVAQEGLMKRIVGGSYINPIDPATGKRPELMRLIRENRIEAYSWPIGATMHWLREVARRSPGYMTSVGLDTYIDPANGGGKFTERAKDDLVRRIDFEGKPYLFYPTWKLDTVFVCASSADEPFLRAGCARFVQYRAGPCRKGRRWSRHRAGAAQGASRRATRKRDRHSRYLRRRSRGRSEYDDDHRRPI